MNDTIGSGQHTVTDRSRDPLERGGLTVEVALWILIVAVALALRLFRLGAAPLSADEAREATLALRAASGRGFPTTAYNPVLLAANGLLFTLCGTSDFLARLLSAVFGACLVLAMWLFRRRVGRVGALAAAVYLAISPTALTVSRQLAGTGIAASAALAAFGAVMRYLASKKQGWLALAAVCLALAVASGAAAYAVLVPLGVAWSIGMGPRPWDRASGLRDRLSQLTPHLPQLLWQFALVLVVLCTGLGWNPAGLAAVGDVLVDLFERFRPTEHPAASPILLMAAYELTGFVFGIGGLVWGLRTGRRVAAWLALWAGLALVLLMLMPGRMPTDLIWVVLPLAMLVGVVVETLVLHWSSRDLALRAAYGGLVLVLWAYAYLMLSRYAEYGDQADLALGLVAVVVQALLGLSFGFALGPAGALWMSTAATGVVLVALTVSAGWGVAYGHPADPREALLREPTALGARDLAETLRTLSWEQKGMPTELEFAFEAPEDSVLAWYLRDFDRATRVDRISALPGGDLGALVVARGTGEASEGLVGDQYAGQDFAIRRGWNPSELECRVRDGGCGEAVGWFLFRDKPALPEAVDWATLWRRVEDAGQDAVE